MPTYRAIAATETDPEAPLTSSLAKAWADNLLASLEADSTAPVNQTAWHPYNKVTNGDANTGRIWSFAVDGAVAVITTPDFVDGYDYAFLFDRVLSNANTALQVNLFRETGGAYAGVSATGITMSTTAALTGQLDLLGPRLVRSAHSVIGTMAAGTVADVAGVAAAVANTGGARHATAQRISRMQFSIAAAGNFQGTGAAIYMLRRRNVAV